MNTAQQLKKTAAEAREAQLSKVNEIVEGFIQQANKAATQGLNMISIDNNRMLEHVADAVKAALTNTHGFKVTTTWGSGSIHFHLVW